MSEKRHRCSYCGAVFILCTCGVHRPTTAPKEETEMGESKPGKRISMQEAAEIAQDVLSESEWRLRRDRMDEFLANAMLDPVEHCADLQAEIERLRVELAGTESEALRESDRLRAENAERDRIIRALELNREGSRGAVRALGARVAELEADGKRLDWLHGNFAVLSFEGIESEDEPGGPPNTTADIWQVNAGVAFRDHDERKLIYRARTPRKAIDAARGAG